MSNLREFVLGIKTLETVVSPVNGKLEVVVDLAWGTYIKGGGLTQSGGVAEKVWRASLSKILNSKLEVRNSLILGLGGGSIAKIIREQWSEAKIEGVDIDSVIVELGKKHLGLDSKYVDITIGDAGEHIKKLLRDKKRFDLVCVDTYVKDSFPEQFEAVIFLTSILKLLTKDGVAIFNRLYYGSKRKDAEKFCQFLERVFQVERVYIEANVMFICKPKGN